MESSAVINNKTSFISKVVDFFKDYIIPYALAILILFTSGYAKTTSRQFSFNKPVLIVLLVVFLIMAVAVIAKTPISEYKKLLHPVKNKIFKNIKTYYLSIPVLLFIGLSVYYYFKGNDLFTLGHYAALIGFAFVFVLLIPFKKFIDVFNRTLLILSLLSLVLYVCSIGLGRQDYYSSTFVNSNETEYFSFIGMFFRTGATGIPRNYGPFWEPGIYSLVLICGIIFELLFKEKPSIFPIVVFGLTVITTLSTSGIILVLLCVPLYFAKLNKKLIFYITLGVMGAIIVGFAILGSPSFRIPFFSDIFDKLFAFTKANSLKTRLFSPLYGGYLSFKSYGLGYGPNIFDEKYVQLTLFGLDSQIAQTSTIGWLIGSYGILGLIVCVICFVALFNYVHRKINLTTAIFILLFYLIAINCEPMYTFSIFWIVLLYPALKWINDIVANNDKEATLYSSLMESNSSFRLTFSNLAGSMVIKVLALLIGLFTYPLYVAYFGNQTPFVSSGTETTYGSVALGAWLVILQILSWILTFDIGIGNGLKNKLVEALNEGRDDDVRKYLSCSYISNLLIVIILLSIGLPIIFSIDFNSLLNVSEEVISSGTLRLSFALAFISICLEFFLKIVLNIYQALQKQVIASLIPLISTILLLLFTLIIRMESMENALITVSIFYIFAVNVPLVVASIILFATRFKALTPSFKLWSFKVAKEVISLGGVFFFIQMFLLIINSTNKVVISNVYGAAEVTYYEPYLKIFSAICAVGSAISLPVWTLAVRAVVRKDYGWMKKMEKIMLIIIGVFVLGSLLAAGILQFIFNIWLGNRSFTISYFKAFAFALWAILSICSYFATAFSNGLKILKPQLLLFGIGSIVKIPLFMLIHYLIPTIDWVVLVLIDSAIMAIASIVLAIINHKEINKRIKLGI